MIKKQMYKIILSVMLLLSSSVLWATPSLTVENKLHNAALDYVQVPVNVTNDANVASLQFDLVYPAGVVQAVAAFAGTNLSNTTHLVDSQLISSAGGNDTFRVIVAAQTSVLADRNISDGNLVNVSFMVNRAQFNQNVLVNIQNVTATNATGDSASIPVNTFGGLIVTLNDSATDSDGDGISDSAEIAFGTDPSSSGGVLIPSGSTLSGQITENSVLEPGGSYVVSSNLEITSGTRLRMYNNTTLAFNYGVGLTVNGELDMLGDGNTFTSSYASPFKGGWYGITINEGAAGVSFNNANIQWATYGLYFNNAGGSVSGTILQNNTYGIYVYRNADPQISTGNTITNNSYGIYIYSTRVAGDVPNPVINYNSIHGNQYYDLYASGVYNASNYTINAENNWWGTTSVPDLMAKIYDNIDYSYYSPKVDFVDFLDSENGTPIDGNVIGGNYTGQILNAGETYHVIEKLTVPVGETLNVPEGVTFMFYGTSNKLLVDGTLNVQGTTTAPVTFRSNNNSSGWSAWQGIELTSNASGVVINNAVVKDASSAIYFNSASGQVSNTRLENSYYGLNIRNHSTSLISGGNEIINNGYGVYAYGGISASTTPSLTVTNNSIYNNSYYDFYAYGFYNAPNVTVDATYNWWGTIDTAVINSHIFDNTENNWYSPIVNYTPYLDAQNGNPVGLPDQPTAVISGPASGDINTSLFFDGTGSSDPQGDTLAYSWDMGDGTNYSTSAVNHVYATTGTYTVTLTVSDGINSNSANITVAITDPNAGGSGSSAFELYNVLNPGQPFMPGDGIVVRWGDINSPDPDTFSWRYGIFPVGGNNYSMVTSLGSSTFAFNASLGKWSSYTLWIGSGVQTGEYEIRFFDSSYNQVGDPSPSFTIGVP